VPIAVKQALRQLFKSPLFVGISVLMIGLGIGLSTSTFSMTKGVLFSRVPFPGANRLFRVFSTSSFSEMMDHSPGNFLDIRAARLPSIDGIAAYVPESSNVAELGKPPTVQFGLSVTANFLTLLQIRPAMGRGFEPDDDQPGKGDGVILTDAFWRKTFAANPSILGKTLRIQDRTFTVVGVLPPSFGKALLWYGLDYMKPLTVYEGWRSGRKDKWVSIFARIKPGAQVTESEAELATLAARMDHDYPADNGTEGLRLVPLASSFVDQSALKVNWLITGLAILVLVIACANLASVQMARAFSRSHEFAIRAALGAARVDLMLPLVIESLVLSILGGGAGLLIAYYANALVAHLTGGGSPAEIDGIVLLFAFLAAGVTAVTFGFTPAWLASRVSSSDAMKDTSRGSTSGMLQRRIKLSLVVVQFAFALLLVSAALSFGVAIKRFLNRDTGWKAAGLVSGVINMPYGIFKNDLAKPTIVRDVQENLSRIPGVSLVSLATNVPIYDSWSTKRVVAEGGAPLPRGQEPICFITGVGAGFFDTLGIPLLQGNALPKHFDPKAPSKVVINEAMAHRFWPGHNPIGKRIKLMDIGGWREIIGVVGDVSTATGFATPMSSMQVYWDLHEEPGIWYNFILKTSVPMDTLMPEMRKAIGDANSDLMVEQVGPIPVMLEGFMSGDFVVAAMFGAFAFIGLLMALVGLYGVVSQLTSQRSREIGIRMALGADYRAIMSMVLRQGALLIVIGSVIGLLTSLAVNRVFHQTMPELALPGAALPTMVALLLSVAGLLACFFPARHAGRVDAVVALRSE
jgi:putative ABC transport system permease protein